tara:strand:- start:3754 stop:5502 length:1749 start_codon:yes stop_codon:yes gene_type:complete
MKLLSSNKKKFFLLILFILYPALYAEDSVDIWKKKNLDKNNSSIKTKDTILNKVKTNIDINAQSPKEIEVSTNNSMLSSAPIYGIYDPNENNFTLDMWVNSEGTRIKDTIDRINKIKLSSFAEEIFVKTLFTISSLPNQNMTDKEFLNHKIEWLIKNKKDDLISLFLNKNKNFPNKSKIIKYLVDQNIAKADLNKACEKVSLISGEIKDSYLDQFKVICLININKKNEAQLLFDLLREQKLSNKFFDNKINYLLGVTDKEDQKIDETNLLNFYLSSITIPDFNYTPSKKTDPKVWQYLAAANIIKIENFENKDQIKELEIAANNNSLAKSYILEVYKNIKFNFNDLLNIDEVYPTFDSINARALVYQKILLSDNNETKLKYLFLLNNLFKKDNLQNIFKEYLSQELKKFDIEKIPFEYQVIVAENIIHEEENKLGKVKYSDKTYHTSKITKFYVEDDYSKKNAEKELANIHKKIKKNKKYKISLKDIILLESLEADNFSLPKDVNFVDVSKKNFPPIELVNLVKNKEIGLVLLRIVELIGEDELLDLDHQTIYFINHVFLKAKLTTFRNKILTTVLPNRSEI